MMLYIFLCTFMALVTFVESVAVTRGEQDAFSVPGIPGNMCQAFSSYWKTETSCMCQYNTNTFYNNQQSDYACKYPTAECIVDVTNPLITYDRTLDQKFGMTNCNKCNHILGMYLWNLQSVNDKRGTWIDVTSKATSFVGIQKPDVYFYSSKMDNDLWKGQLLKITFNSNVCLLLKVAGDIDYPFDSNKLFTSTTQKPTITTTTTTITTTTKTTTKPPTKPFTQPSTQPTTQSSTKPNTLPPTKLPTPPPTKPPTNPSTPPSTKTHKTTQLPLKTVRTITSTTKPTTIPSLTEPHSNKEPIQQHLSGTPYLPSWVVPVLVVLAVLVLLLLVIVMLMCKRQSQAKTEGEKKNSRIEKKNGKIPKDDKKRFSSEGIDNAIYLSVDNNSNAFSSPASDSVYEQPEQHTYMYTVPIDTAKSSTDKKQKPVHKSISMSALLAKEEELATEDKYAQLDYIEEDIYATGEKKEEYAELSNFNEDVYATGEKKEEYAELSNFNEDVYAKVAGSYVSMNDKYIKSNASVRI